MAFNGKKWMLLTVFLSGLFTPVFASERPNIILILTDDQGYGDLGVTGNPVIETPNIDELFNQGVRFDRFYVSPVCSPTRASLLTGKASLATGVFHVTRGGEKMFPQLKTLAEWLKPVGYTSGLFGKWHNGLQYPHDPIGQGFDEFYGFSDGHKTRYFDDVLQHNQTQVPFSGYIADRLTDKAIDFIKDNKHQPFFTMLSYNTPHGPFIAPQALFEKYKSKGLSDLDSSIYGMVENIDINVARVMKTLDSLSLTDNTVIIYLSDNGAAFPKGIKRYNAGLKGHKGTVDEGGVRTPFIIKWPNGLPTGGHIEQIAQHVDLLPTLLDMLEIEYSPQEFDGKSLKPLMLEDNDVIWPDRHLFTHRFQISKNSSIDPVHFGPGAVRNQRWLATLNERNQWQLFDLLADPGQQIDVRKQHSKVLLRLQGEYRRWFESMIVRHQPFTTQAIEVGHTAALQVQLPAHEGFIVSDGLKYQYNDGWAHDWITNENGISNGVEKGTIEWPVKVVTSGQYQFEVQYGTPYGEFEGSVSLALVTGVNEEGHMADNPASTNVTPKTSTKLATQTLAPFRPIELPSTRQFMTSEAAEYQWGTANLTTVTLKAGSQQRLRLQLNAAKPESTNNPNNPNNDVTSVTNSQLVTSEGQNAPNVVWIKSINITKTGD